MTGRLYDISMNIESGMIRWPSEKPVRVDQVRSMEKGDRLNKSHLEMSAHAGTHVDAPVHFLDGADGVESLPLDILVGRVEVIHVPGVRAIGRDQLTEAGLAPGVERLLLKTDNGDLLDRNTFDEDFSFLSPEGADHIAGSGVRLVGIDYLSIAEYGKGEEVHQCLLEAGIVVLEGLDLRKVPSGSYNLIALPLKITGCDGAPARVVLEEEQ